MLSPSVVLILGFANLFADGFSMAIGNYLSAKSRIEYVERQRKREEWEIKINTDSKNTRELKTSIRIRDLKEELLEKYCKKSLFQKERFGFDTMMEEKIGLVDNNNENPIYKAITTFLLFTQWVYSANSVYLCIPCIF